LRRVAHEKAANPVCICQLYGFLGRLGGFE
jgi:hypothetical protein